MAKKSQRRPVRYEKDQLGCMWGLINIFDFRRGGASQKLISDRRRGSSRRAVGAGNSATKLKMLTDFEEGQGIDDHNESTAGTADANKPSVKKLIEEEMVSEPEPNQQISSMEVDEKDSQSEPEGGSRKNRKRTNRTRNKTNDIHVHDLSATENLGSEETLNLDINAIMDELCSQIQQKNISCTEHAQQSELHKQSGQKHSDFEERLSEATKVFITHKFVSKEHLTGDGKIHHSKEFMDALQTLISNKDLFMELLEDPNSLLVKHIQTLQDTMAEKDEKSKSKSKGGPSDTRQSEEFANRKQHNFFRRKMKSQQIKPSKENESSQASNRIVILKPGPAGLQDCETERSLGSLPQAHYIVKHNSLGDRSASHFSFTEIKRKLKHAMGKERSGISPDGLSHKIPCLTPNLGYGDKGVGGENVGRKSPSRNLVYNERFPKLSTGLKNGNKTGKGENCEISMEHATDGFPGKRVSNIYIEAKKHLSEMLKNGDEEEAFSSGQVPKTLGRILSLPEYNFSPLYSPRRDWEHGFVTAQMRFSAQDKVQGINESALQIKQDNTLSNSGPLVQNSETTSCISDRKNDDKVEDPNSNPDISDKLINNDKVEEAVCSVRDEMSSEGDVEAIRTIDIQEQEENNVLDCESSSSSIIEDDTSEICDLRVYPECARLDLLQESEPPSSPLASPSSSPIISKVENIESEIDRTDRPSPISVLEPLFEDDDISPASTISCPAQPLITPLRIQFEEHDSSARDQGSYMKTCMEDLESIFEYCEAVLLTSGICWDEFCMKSLSSDQLLDPSLFDEVVFFSNQLCHDQKLLFDCINEVLVEICEHYFGCGPWVSFVKPNIKPVPNMENTIGEVCEGVEWHLIPHLPSRSLEQIVSKDLAKNGKWMDLRFDTESIGADMSEEILDELMEDTILSCLEENVGSDFSALSAELEDNECCINL